MQWFDQPGGPRPGELLKSHVIVSDHSLSRPVGSDSTSLDQRTNMTRCIECFTKATETRSRFRGSATRQVHDRCHLPRKLRSSVTLTNLLRYTRQRNSVTGTATRSAFRFSTLSDQLRLTHFPATGSSRRSSTNVSYRNHVLLYSTSLFLTSVNCV